MTRKYIEVGKAAKLAIDCCKFHVPCPSAFNFDIVFGDEALSLDEMNEVREKGRLKRERAKRSSARKS